MTLSKKIIVSFTVAAVLLLPFAPFSPRSAAPNIPKVVVLGFDGIDPVLLEEYMQKGELPNFDSLRKTGGFSKLATTNPPQSPVAWASFMTGANPGKHNVFDFLTRDPKTYMPKLTITEIEPPEGFEVMGYNISLKSPLVIGYRKGKTFWQVASEAGVPSTVLLIPVTFPPDPNAKMLSGMGVPDVTGTNGTFSFYTTDPLALTGAEGGRIVHVTRKGNSIRAELVGPRNDLLKERPQTKIPFTAEITGEGRATVRVQGREFEILQGRFSEWKHIEFKLAPFVTVKTIARFLLVSTKPEIGIYVSPLNFDPAEPALPISNPPGYSAEVEKEIGPYATQGMPEDTWALTENVIDDATFLEQVKLVQKERERIFFLELGKLKGGILAAVFVSSDRVSHMFWRYRDSGHPLHSQMQNENIKDPVLEVYKHMDTILGRTMKYLDGDATLIVVSDHGFKSFRRAVHLNRWLIENGYMALKKGGQKGREAGVFFSDVDWSRTKAFALGMNGLYLNIAGREKEGIVTAKEVTRLKKEIAAGLVELIDGKNGAPVVRRVFDTKQLYNGDYADNAPDLVVGYGEGYRASWQTALGGAPRETIVDNLKKWSGDHLIDPELVPGIFLSNRKFAGPKPGSGGYALIDIAPTILSVFGLEDSGMDGKAIDFKKG